VLDLGLLPSRKVFSVGSRNLIGPFVRGGAIGYGQRECKLVSGGGI